MVIMEEPDSSRQSLLKEIQEQSQTEIAAVMEQAEKEARKILEEARNQAERIKSEQLQKAENMAEGIKRKILSGVHLETKKQTLHIREEIIAKIYDNVKKKLDKFRETDAYVPFVEKIVIQGVEALHCNTIQIIAGEKEKKLLTRSMLSKLEKQVAGKGQKKLTLTLSDETLKESGVICISSDGRVRFDNRFSTRIQRMNSDMRLEIMRRLFAD